MLPLQRHEAILRQLELLGVVRTVDLVRLLEVTDETIRRDLCLLEKQGRVIRIHGGARLPSSYRVDLPLKRRRILEREAKQQIAKGALRRIQSGSILFFDASSTALTLAENLPDVEFTVLTNALDVISVLEARQRIKVIGTGGKYERKSRSFVGNAAVDTVRRHQINQMFFGCNGVDSLRGASEINQGQAALKESIRQLCDQCFLLADYTKLDVKSDHFFMYPAQIDCVITDQNADKRKIVKLEQAGIDVEVVNG